MRPGDPRGIPDEPPPSWGPVGRHPAAVPDDGHPEPGSPVPAVPVAAGVDSDGDGTPDTWFGDDEEDLLVHTDLDGDGRVDRTLRIGRDGGPALVGHRDPDPLDPEDAGHPPLVEILLRLLRIGRGPLG